MFGCGTVEDGNGTKTFLVAGFWFLVLITEVACDPEPETRNQKLRTGVSDPPIRNIDHPVPVFRVFLVMGYLDNGGAAVV